jgi:hypothetical protein
VRKKDDSSIKAFQHRSPYEVLNSWNDPITCPTLFNIKYNGGQDYVKPLLRYQENQSSVCYLVAGVNAIYYNQVVQHPTYQQYMGANVYVVNVSRYMRYEFTNEETFKYIYNNAGGYTLDSVAKMLARCNNSQEVNRSNAFYIVNNFDFIDPHHMFEEIERALKTCGPLIVAEFRVFKSYVDTHKMEFSLKDYEPLEILHSVLIVGVQETTTPGFGGLKLLIQDSLAARPFFTIGLSVLRSMDQNHFYAIRPGYNFTSGVNNIQEETPSLAYESGGPIEVGEPTEDDWFHNRNLKQSTEREESQVKWMMKVNRDDVIFT